MAESTVHDAFDRAAAAVADQVIAWRQHLHQHPELSNREEKTAELIANHLHSLKLDEVRTGIAGHGVVGVLRGGRPGDRVIALRADIDALPVPDECGEPFASQAVDERYPGGPFSVSHACGHDCHTAMLMGAASVLADVRENLPGTVLFIFQPAEEGPPIDEKGGAREMLEQGACDDLNPTMAFGMHVFPYPKGSISLRVGNQCSASCLVKIVLNGEQVHGSMPWMGIDTMPAVGAILTGIGQIYRQTNAYDPITVSIGHIEDVGRFNIVGQTTTLWGTIRCAIESDMADVQGRVQRLAANSAQAFGCTADVEFLQGVPAVHNSQAWVDAATPSFQRVVGADMVLPNSGTLAYDDVSEFVNRYGGLYVMLGVQDIELDADNNPRPVDGGRGLHMNHNPHFYADDNTLVTGVRVHCHVAYDHLVGDLLPRT
ncbi:amidohydrolase [Mycobacteroides immunogenum]|uniref:M20 metallopeptidase family protein n=1 Tax=Mycobacteroides immunogenum TaxID=83262 RepID=UPI0025B77328|nr:amidohydrolase [Mycobacteroides immunogenum]WJR36134.1 amidohydrolase [Mycobacteroides immunogenum]